MDWCPGCKTDMRTGLDGRCEYCGALIRYRQYTQADLDAAVAAERQRCAQACDRALCDDSSEPEYDRGYRAALSHVLKDILADGKGGV